MTSRSRAPLALLIALSCTLALVLGSAATVGPPTSVGLLYLPKKNFTTGDWVLYKVRGKNMQNPDMSTDYQRVQIGQELSFRGEKCFWLETGFGSEPTKLSYAAVMVSENIYQDSFAVVRPNAYMRKMTMDMDEEGNHIVSEIRTVNPKGGSPDMHEYLPTTTEIGSETLDTPKGKIPCKLFEITRTYRAARDGQDSTFRQITETKTRRWVNADLVPITGLVKEDEVRTISSQTWPLGKPSKDFPFVVMDRQEFHIEMVDYGHRAKPQVINKIKDADDRQTAEP